MACYALFTSVIFCFSSAFGCGLFTYFVVGFCSVPAQTVQWHSLGKGAIVLESQVFRQRDSCFGSLGKFQNCASFSSGKIWIAVFTFPPIVFSFFFSFLYSVVSLNLMGRRHEHGPSFGDGLQWCL